MKRIDFNRKEIANALVWAAMMIAASLLMKDSGNGQSMLLLMVAGWFVTKNLIRGTSKPARGKCAAKVQG